MKTHLDLLDEFPPALCRLIARHNRRGLTDGEIAKRAGWSIQKVVQIASMASWEYVPVGEASTFMSACGVYPANIRHHRRYIRRTLMGKNPLARLRLAPGSTLRLLAALPKGVGA